MTPDRWDPFEPVTGQVLGPDGVVGELFENDRYQVIRREYPDGPFGAYVHLTIRRRDGAACHDWRDFQRIKNELVGPETEGVEIYPAESRLVDTANHYHLWVFRQYTIPLGMNRRELSDGGAGVSQRPHSEGLSTE
ncbi:MAG: hypothetical protein FJX77_15105 [Armatimonadetes bacterium]|nr:hypothetical protein [Armatimonadota bacterium]